MSFLLITDIDTCLYYPCTFNASGGEDAGVVCTPIIGVPLSPQARKCSCLDPEKEYNAEQGCVGKSSV
jgi:hypothetical protein